MAQGMFWTYTSRLYYSLTTSTYTYTYAGTDLDSYTFTRTRTISPSVTPTRAAVSTSTYERTYEDLEVIYEYYPPGAVADSDLVPETTYDPDATTTTTTSYTGTVFLMPVTYTAPASCPTQFTYSTDEVVNVPTEVADQLTPASIVTDPPSTYSTWVASAYETWYLTAGAAPLTTASEYAYSAYIADCEKPYSSHNGDDDDPSSSLQVCTLYSGCTSLKTWVIIIAALLPGLFVLGFIESWFWFRRLMTGRGCLRFGTVCWVMISLWVLCFTRTQSARSKEDQKLLRERWNATGSGQALKLWFKYGFRHRYPTELLGQYSRNTVGIVPDGQTMPQMGHAGPGMGGPPPPPSAYINQGGVGMSPPPQGQVYYPPPQGYGSPPPQVQGYAPPPGSNVSYYGEQPKEVPIVTETPTTAPVLTPSPPVPAPPPNVAEVPNTPVPK